MKYDYNKNGLSELTAKNRPSGWVNAYQKRKADHSWKKNSTIIALNVLTLLEQKGWSQVRLAQEMEVSAAQVSKIVKGQVNFTLESISKLENALGQTLLNIDIIDPEREHRNHVQLVAWLEKSKPVSTPKGFKKMPVDNITVKSSFSIIRSIPEKEFNSSVLADNNLRPTG